MREGDVDQQQASAVEGAHDAERTAVDDVRVDHRRADVLVAEQGLDGADVRPGFEEVRGEAVAERVAGRALVEGGGRGGVADGLLQGGLVEVMEHESPGRRVGAGARRWEEVLPREARRGAGHLRAERVGEVDLAASQGELCQMDSAHEIELGDETLAGPGGQEGRAVVGTFATTDGDLTAVEVDVLHAEGEGLLEAETGAVEDLAEEAEGRLELLEQGHDVAAREDGGEVLGTLGALEAVERGQVEFEHLAVEEDEGAEGLVLGGGRDGATQGEVVEEGGDLGGAHLPRVTSLVEADEVAYPADVGLLGAGGVVQAAEGDGDGLDEGHGGTPGARGKRDEPGCRAGGGEVARRRRWEAETGRRGERRWRMAPRWGYGIGQRLANGAEMGLWNWAAAGKWAPKRGSAVGAGE